VIEVGLTGWGDHDGLYRTRVKPGDKLRAYSSHFPVVEVDSSFYAVQPERNFRKWLDETPPGFGFVVKAYQGMTGHLRGENPFADTEAMYAAFLASIGPVQAAGKLRAVLFQYPPWFECDKAGVAALREAKARMGDVPVALEFRHQSWFAPALRERTLAFMERENWMHSICDEPQAGAGSVPIVLHATHPELTLVRFHGCNAGGWNQGGAANWRDVRYLYRYNREELLEWKERLEQLHKQVKNILVIFNNNSGGDAADNAKQLMELLGLSEDGLAPRQLDLF